MKKVLKVEVIMQNPILLLNDKSFHIVLFEPIPVTQLTTILKFYADRQYEFLDCSKLSELDFSELRGNDQALYQFFKNRLDSIGGNENESKD